jgi:hypothetical protein
LAMHDEQVRKGTVKGPSPDYAATAGLRRLRTFQSPRSKPSNAALAILPAGLIRAATIKAVVWPKPVEQPIRFCLLPGHGRYTRLRYTARFPRLGR